MKLPAALSNIQGLVYEDVAEHARYNPADNTYVVPDSAVAALSGLAERVAGELGELNPEMEHRVPTLGDFVAEATKNVTFECESDF